MMFIIKSKKHGDCEVFIDDEDFEKVRQYKWSVSYNDKLYVSHNRKNGLKMTLHRFLLNFPEKTIDHINGNGLDNRKQNLRLCSNAQNFRNRGKSVTNTSGYKGVTWSNQHRKWMAQISINYKRKTIGVFNSKDQAAIAYNIAALKYHGEFAKLNNVMKFRNV